MRPKPRRLTFVVALALALGAAAAAAQTPREQAIALADEGSRRMENKDYAGALEKFDAAFALVAVPVFALQAASALEMSGRWVDALARYRRTFEMAPDAVPAASAVRPAARKAQEARPAQRRPAPSSGGTPHTHKKWGI